MKFVAKKLPLMFNRKITANLLLMFAVSRNLFRELLFV
jgi:hypothetical protein